MLALAIDFTQPFEDAFSKLLSFIPNLLGGLVIPVYAAFAALTQLGIAVQLTGNTLLIVLAGAALALGLAFGLGGREMAGRALTNLFDRDTMIKSPGSNGTMGSNGTAGYPADPQPPATHGASQGWSNGTPSNGNWPGGQ